MLGAVMPYRFEFDARHGLLAARFSGKLTEEVLVAYYTEAPKHVMRYAVRAGLMDFTDAAGVDISTAIVQRLAAIPTTFPDPIPRVIIAPSNLLFGLSRMYKSLSVEERQGLHVVRTEQEALDHLDIRGELQFEALPPVER